MTRDQLPRLDFCAAGAGLRPYAVDLAADDPGDQPRPDGRRFRHAAADAGEPDLDLSFCLRRLADSGRRRDGPLWRPAGFAEPADRNHRRRDGVRPRHRAGEFSVRAVPARGRDLGHADVPDDAGRQADVGGAVRPVVRRDPVDRQYRHAAVVEPAGLCRRASGAGAQGSGSPPASALWWRLPCSCWCRNSRPRMRTVVAAVADGRSAAPRPVASAARPDRAGAGLAGGLAGAAGIVGRSVADAGQGAEPRSRPATNSACSRSR